MFTNFDVQEQLSTSPTGDIHRANHPLMDRSVLIKVLPEATRSKEEAVKRFEREIRLAARLSHPNLIGAHHAGCEDGVHFLVLEDVQGGDL